ncbi:rRNA-binding endoribonuclease [Spizellomyces punctatus DAOM BR117]|uniref:20S-pre-rRNA D-site endonuclease NOB1 n=1 Tax=Spizellomyces punctatus (strain DAOM BR117) TaxID=645134 RepID=A0A0L0HU02_SPIPD|nr:rRNA-binding endoribonuclease [Spizellomyces punctatus DAOM BR117]KND04395.1 hypothetical protein SPPG_00126 [Spizellomyces punctatus DAOM BR117]|eukprot:XP_016612434.1 hypothetical protein SPPG_00126 [Spizellomyces punctatus DAOM BR117]
MPPIPEETMSSQSLHFTASAPAATAKSVSKGRDTVLTLVVDAAPLIKGTPLGHLAEGFITIPEVLKEIRDRQARQALAQLHFDLETRVPSEEAMAAVISFSKKTGDFASLSATDLKVLALTWMIEKEVRGVEHLRTEPVNPHARKGGKSNSKTNQQPAAQKSEEGAASINNAEVTTRTIEQKDPGLNGEQDEKRELEQKRELEESSAEKAVNEHEEPTHDADEEVEVIESDEDEEVEGNEDDREESEEDDEDEVVDEEGDAPTDAEIQAAQQRLEALSLSRKENESIPTPTMDEHEDADDQGEWISTSRNGRKSKSKGRNLGDEEGWITPANVQKHKARHLFGTPQSKQQKAPEVIPVACITSDFAMQNVLLQMGLRLLSVDGVTITRVKNFVLRCHACYKVTKDMEKKFCPSCGNSTLIRTTVGVDSDGKVTYYLKKNFQYNTRGTKYNIPLPKGGRQNDDLLLREDQREYQRALNYQRRAKTSVDPFDLDFVPLDGKTGSHRGGMPTIGHGRKNVNVAKKSRQKRR